MSLSVVALQLKMKSEETTSDQTQMVQGAELSKDKEQKTKNEEQPLDPSPEELAVLSGMERIAFRFAHRMNQGRWKRFWAWCQRMIGSRWIQLSTYNLMRVYGLEHVEAVSHDRPLLLVANHRSFFDMYTVSSVLFRRTSWDKILFFPVRGRFFYDSPLGMMVNLLMGWWSMYPPIFAENERRLFDKYSVRRLAQLCREGRGHVIGFHPEGTRNQSEDPYNFLRAQPGVGKIIKDARPQVIPVFIAGLGNNLMRQVIANWTGGEPIRLRFGAPLDLSNFLEKKDHVRTYKEISEFVMEKIAELGEEDRAIYALQGLSNDRLELTR